MKVRIPFVVGPEGRWCAYGYPSAQTDPDWAMLMDNADNGEETQYDYQRGWIEVDLPEPKAEVTAMGTATLANGRGDK